MTETEIKLPVEDVSAVRRELRRLGWRSGRRRFECNLIYDRPDGSLAEAGFLLRVREVDRRCWLTLKRPPRQGGPHKVREEFEIEASDAEQTRRLIEGLGFQPAWRYEKYRSTFTRSGQPGKIEVDETPVGCYLELEGPGSWIDATARQLGYSNADYITATYRDLFLEAVQKGTYRGDHLVFA